MSSHFGRTTAIYPTTDRRNVEPTTRARINACHHGGVSTAGHRVATEQRTRPTSTCGQGGNNMTNELRGVRVAFMVANEGIEEVELTEPWKAVLDAGGSPRLIAPKSGEVQAMHHMDKGDKFHVDRTTSEVSADDFDALVLPGGVANPDQLRMDEPAVNLVRAMFDAGKPVAAICHGPWTLVEAGVVRDRTLTSWPSLKTDIGNAGGSWVDEEVVVDTKGPNTLITSRKPDDLKAFNREITEVFSAPRD
jgi:protease I